MPQQTPGQSSSLTRRQYGILVAGGAAIGLGAFAVWYIRRKVGLASVSPLSISPTMRIVSSPAYRIPSNIHTFCGLDRPLVTGVVRYLLLPRELSALMPQGTKPL